MVLKGSQVVYKHLYAERDRFDEIPQKSQARAKGRQFCRRGHKKWSNHYKMV
jgi:hypothetical protein